MTASPAASVRRFAARFLADDTGATAVEYGLLASLMALACITAFTQVGGAGGGAWGNVANKVGNAMK
jgi:pilus assembly protein Flp/PilA